MSGRLRRRASGRRLLRAVWQDARWHADVRPAPVLFQLTGAALVSVLASTFSGRLRITAAIWLATAVLVAGYRLGPRGALAAAGGASVVLGVLSRNLTTAAGLQDLALAALAYAVLGLTATAAFQRLFLQISLEHDLRIREVEEERNRALQVATERERLQHELIHSATHDSLTGLPNRTLLVQRIAQALQGCRETGTHCAVLFLDLDDFKPVNDTMGHAAGDQLLRVVAQRLQTGLRPTDLVARLGGDEFAVLFPQFDPQAGELIVERVTGTLSAPVKLADRQVSVHASAGLAVSDGTDSPHGLLGKADLAMYAAKEAGKGRAAAYEQRLHEQVQERALLEADLKNALVNRELEVYYQPLVSLETGSVNGYEALLRWHSPARGPVPPDKFIPLAEATGAIVEIGNWVLHQACRQLARWQRLSQDLEALTVAVNVSARQLTEPNFLERVQKILYGSGINPRNIVLEITESLVMEDDVAVGVLWSLKTLGVRLAMDDFGTGYSSLSRLGRLPIDKLKIDKSFVQSIATGADNRGNAQLISASVAMARGFNLSVVAEGIETEEQAALLRHVGCHEGQGYLFSRPFPGGDGLPEVLQWSLPEAEARLLEMPAQLSVPLMPALPAARSTRGPSLHMQGEMRGAGRPSTPRPAGRSRLPF